ncbi:MAG: LysM peptidoglycan-binding domain-containing protein [Candidatus Binatia bacterium]
MESEISGLRPKHFLISVFVFLLIIGVSAPGYNQEGTGSGQSQEKADIRLQKAIKTRQYQGESVEGEERVVAPGDTMWKFLTQDKGLPEYNFRRYVILLRSLNPKLQNPNILRVGDVIFIPIRPDEILGIQIPPGKGGAKFYRVKRGEYLYKILREQRGLKRPGEILGAFNQVKRLNPRKENWDLIFVGEAILLPPLEEGEQPTVILEPAREFIGLDYGQKLNARENLGLLQKVIGVMGNEMTSEGEEELALKEGTIHLDRSVFPVIENSRLGKKILLDLDEMIAPSILTQIQMENRGIGVVSEKKGSSLHKAANSLFSHLGFQSLPSDRPVELQDMGVGVKVRGEWMVTNPDEGGARQEMWIINLTDGSDPTPDYLRDYLALKGMNLREVLLPASPVFPGTAPLKRNYQGAGNQIQTWPRDKKALVDKLLQTYQISFKTKHQISFSLRKGMRLVTIMDRFFEYGGRKYGIFFRPVGEEVSKTLERKMDIIPIVLELESLSSRQILTVMLAGLGEGSGYQEHRFPVMEKGPKDKLVLTVSGFFLGDRSLLLTDRTIPEDLQRFFFEKGLRVVYF